MTLACRTLLLVVFALYWGGLTFYTGIVVRIAHDVLNDPMDGGLITQRVTTVLQLLGVGMIALMVWNNVLLWRHHTKLAVSLFVCTLLLVCALAGLFVTHGQLDSVIDTQAGEITNREAFTAGHQRYNQWTTLQWVVVLAYLPLTVFAWSKRDGAVSVAPAGHPILDDPRSDSSDLTD